MGAAIVYHILHEHADFFAQFILVFQKKPDQLHPCEHDHAKGERLAQDIHPLDGLGGVGEDADIPFDVLHHLFSLPSRCGEQYCMGHAGDTLPQPRGGGGHQRPRPRKEYPLERAGGEPLHDIRAHDAARAAAAGCAGVDILLVERIEHQAAIRVDGGDVDPLLLLQQLDQQFGTHGPQIAGEDHVIIRGLGIGIAQKVGDRCTGRRGHGCAHIVGVLDAQILDAAKEHLLDARAAARLADHRRTGRGGRPLGGGRPLATVLERIAELLFRGGKVRRRGRDRIVGGAAVREHGRHRQGEGHGGARAVQPGKGDVQLPQAKGGGDALVEQVAGKDHVDLRRGERRLGQRADDRLTHEGALRLFPGGLAHGGIGKNVIELLTQRPLALLFTHDGGAPGDNRAGGQRQDIPSRSDRHASSPLIQLKQIDNQTVQHRGRRAVDDHRTGDGEHLHAGAHDAPLCLCQVYPKRFFYFPVEIRQEFFFLYYEASSGIHSPIISVRYLLFSPISIRPLSNTRTLSISRLITSGRYSVKA